jgi:hypothetical protein
MPVSPSKTAVRDVLRSEVAMRNGWRVVSVAFSYTFQVHTGHFPLPKQVKSLYNLV